MNLTNRKFIKDLFSVGFSNVVVLLGSIVTGFVVPKVLGVTDYGIYKVFTLYLGYIPLLHFGFVDGILLKYAGVEYRELDKKLFRMFTRFFVLFQLAVEVLIIFFSQIFMHGMMRFIFVCLGVDAFALNLTSYFQYISQSTMRFRELSIRKILLTLCKIALIVLLYCLYRVGVIHQVTATAYIIGLVFIDVVLVIWYMCTYSEVTFGDKERISEHRIEITNLFKSGIVLTISFQITHIIFLLDRQFVSLLFDTNTYAIYSFAYNLLSIINTVIGAVSLVLFPALKRKDKDTIIRTYSQSAGLVTVFCCFALICYYPLKVFIELILPEYASSIPYFWVILPGLVISCCINLIMFTYFKALDKQRIYCKIACCVLAIAFVLNIMLYCFYNSPISFCIASVFSLMTWYIFNAIYFARNYHVAWVKNFCYMIFMLVAFYVSTYALKGVASRSNLQS